MYSTILVLDVPNTVIWRLYTLWDGHHQKSSYHRSPYKLISIIEYIPYPHD